MAFIEQLGTRGPSYGDRALGRVVIEELKADPDYLDVFDGVELSDEAEALPMSASLPFYKRYVLVELPVSRGRGPEFVFALHIPESDRAQDEKAPSTLWLNGKPDSIHRANQTEGLDLTEENALDYLRFFVNFLRGTVGSFTLLDATDVIEPVESDMTPTERLELVAARERFMRGTLGDAWEKLRVIPSGYKARFPIAYATYFTDLAKFTISNKGEVEMTDEGQRRSVGGLSVLATPEFRRISPTVLQARRTMVPAGREDPEALGRRLAEANKLGDAGNQQQDPEGDEAKQHYDEAIALLHHVVFDYVHLLGPDKPDTIIALTSLELWKLWKNWSEGYDEEALREVRRLFAAQMRSLGSFHPRTLNTRRNIALMFMRNDGRSSGAAPDDAGDAWDQTGHAKAIAELQWLIADIREHLAEDPLGDSSQRDKLEEILVDSQLSLAQAYHEMEDDEAAIEDLKTLLASPKSALPAVTKTLSDARYWLAEYLLGAGRIDEAIAESQARLDELQAADSPDEREIGYSNEQLARLERRRDGDGNDQN